MSDHFEKAKFEILRRTAKNGGPSAGDLLDALEATNEDFDSGLGAVSKLLSDHVKEDKARTRAQAETCAETHRKLINEEFTHQHVTDRENEADMHAALIADAADRAAIKAANLVAETAKKVAGVRVHAAEDAATVLVEAAAEAPPPNLFPEIAFSYRFGKWLAGVAIIIAIGWGLPFWANSCANTNAEKVNEPEPREHVIYQSPSP